MAKPRLRKFFPARHLSKNSAHVYCRHISQLLQYAAELGWRSDADIPPAWASLIEASKAAGCLPLARDLARLRKSPKLVTIEDLDGWVVEVVQGGRGRTTTQQKRNNFLRLMVDRGLLESCRCP